VIHNLKLATTLISLHLVQNVKKMASTPVMAKSGVFTESKSFKKLFGGTSESIASSETESLTCIKRLMSIAISNVTYLRALMPETAFQDRYLGDLHLKIISSGNGGHPLALKIIRHVQACFEAIDRKYLKAMTLWFHEDRERPDQILEAYVFEFDYVADGANVTMSRNKTVFAKTRSGQDMKASIVIFLKTLLCIVEELEPLPSTVFLKIQLSYHAHTPAGYHPTGFHDAATPLTFDEAAIKTTTVGSVASNHHALALRLKSTQSALSWRSASVDPDRTYGLDYDGMEGVETEERGKEPSGRTEASSHAAPAAVTTSGQDSVLVSLPPAPAIETSQVSAPPGTQLDVRCICGGVQDGEMMACHRCEKWQHAICYGVFPGVAAPVIQRHVCVSCADETPEGSCIDPSLQGLTQVALKQKALFRRAILATATSDVEHLSTSLLRTRLEIDENSARGILEKMASLKLLQPVPGDQTEDAEPSFVVVRPELKSFMQKVAKKMRQVLLGENPAKKSRGTKRKARGESEV